ncbi:MAG: hypothetical protein GY794_25010 [bacterium]|nr:hypothetical protein [bacterium]
MARHARRGQSRSAGHGRYDQLHGSSNGGLMAATMILGSLLVISIILTVVAWMGRNNERSDLNALQKKFDNYKMDTVQAKRDDDQELRMRVNTDQKCTNPVCRKTKALLDGKSRELRQANAKLTSAQKKELRYNHDLVAINDSVTYVIDPADSDKQLIQITFTVKNQSTKALGNINGLFKLYQNEKMTWQKNFKIGTLAPGATRDIQLMGPGDVEWNEYDCDLYPSLPPLEKGASRQ